VPAADNAERRTLPLAVVACLVATLAFWAYTRTLLPGVDLGDTGGFQAAVLWPENSARRAYPLYFGLATPFVRAVSNANPARGLNLFSAIWAAVAIGLLTTVCGRLTKSRLAGATSGLLLAFAYTFWTQAVIAEVYALHLTLIAACLLALDAFSRQPTRFRLTAFFAVYALSFGNHLGMILLIIPFAVFLIHSHPRPRELFTASTMLLAISIAAAGALLYAGNLWFVWSSIEAPARWGDRIAAFWLDATKADWRPHMVLSVTNDRGWDRLAMWVWDARQQFGVVGLALAGLGAIRLWLLSKPWAVMVYLTYVITTLFAITYNVGDAHVFFLPGHFFVALAAGIAVGHWRSARLRMTAALAVLLYAGWRGWETWPAADRHEDRRADAYLAGIVEGIDERNALLVARMEWEVENVLLYSSRYERRGLAWVRLDDVFLHFPFLVRDNLAGDRDIVLTSGAAKSVVAAYGAAFPMVRDHEPPPTFVETASRIPRGAPYVLTMLAPPPNGKTVDSGDFSQGLEALIGKRMPQRSEARYEVWAGIAGEAPVLYRSSTHPFDERIDIAGEPFRIRMDAWLPDDTFRRGGFGHVLHGRTRALFIERGLSLLWLRRDGSPASFYGAGLYTPEPRYRIPVPTVHFARTAFAQALRRVSP